MVQETFVVGQLGIDQEQCNIVVGQFGNVTEQGPTTLRQKVIVTGQWDGVMRQ